MEEKRRTAHEEGEESTPPSIVSCAGDFSGLIYYLARTFRLKINEKKTDDVNEDVFFFK